MAPGTNQGPQEGPARAIDWPAQLAQHDRWLRAVVFARLGEHEGVDEVMQEVSLAVIRQRAPLIDPSKVAPWLYRLAVLQSLLYRRRLGRRRKLTNRYADRFQPHESDCRVADPLSWLLDDEQQKTVRTALDRLPRRDVEMLLLKYAEDWNYHQIASHLGISHSAVEARLHRARQRLREELAASQINDHEPASSGHKSSGTIR